MRSLTRDELDFVSGGLGTFSVSFVHSGGNEANTITGPVTGGNSGGTNNENGGNGGPGGTITVGGNVGAPISAPGGTGGDSVSIPVVSNS